MPEEGREKERLGQWIHFLVNPLNEAQQLEFREKRNLYLFLICSGLLSGNVGEFMSISRKKHLKKDATFTSKFAKVKGMRGQAPLTEKTISNEDGNF
jgi:hypothetical protein